MEPPTSCQPSPVKSAVATDRGWLATPAAYKAESSSTGDPPWFRKPSMFCSNAGNSAGGRVAPGWRSTHGWTTGGAGEISVDIGGGVVGGGEMGGISAIGGGEALGVGVACNAVGGAGGGSGLRARGEGGRQADYR